MRKLTLKRVITLTSIILLIGSLELTPSLNYSVKAARRTATRRVVRRIHHRTNHLRHKARHYHKVTYQRQSKMHPTRINKKNKKPTSRFLNYRFVTQKGRGNVNDGCEAASLLMALHHFGLAKNKNLKRLVRTIPRSRNPERGYTSNPYRLGSGASLYPQALLRVAKRYGAKKSYIIDDYYPYRRRGNRLYRRKASTNVFINAILRGHPIVFEGANRMQYGGRTHRWGHRGYRSDHVLLLYGYKHHRFYWTDPDHWHNRPGSTRVNLFMYIINAPVRGPRAVAISK